LTQKVSPLEALPQDEGQVQRVLTSDLRRLGQRSGIVPLNGHCTLLCNSIGNTRAVFDVARQLAAGSINVITSGFANSGHKAGV
jgi:hypothetical protein